MQLEIFGLESAERQITAHSVIFNAAELVVARHRNDQATRPVGAAAETVEVKNDSAIIPGFFASVNFERIAFIFDYRRQVL